MIGLSSVEISIRMMLRTLCGTRAEIVFQEISVKSVGE